MADVSTTFATLSNDAPNVWIAAELTRLTELRLELGKFAQRFTMPSRTGKTLRTIRYKRLALPQVPLTEGVPPDAVALATENVDVTVEQWGIVVLLTDVALITTKHPALNIAIDRTSLAMAEVLEREMAVTLLGGTNVFFPGTATSRATVAAADKLTSKTILKTTVDLRNTGSPLFEGGLYGGVMPPQMEGDLIDADVTFKDLSQFANVRRFEFGEIGVWMGTRWVRGNFLPILKGVGSPAAGDVDVTNPNAEEAVVEAQVAGPYTANSSVKVAVVARDINNDYERKFSQTLTFALGAGNSGYRLRTPNSANYVYDVYTDDAVGGGGTARKAFSRQAADTIVTVGAGFTLPTASAAAMPAAPADTREVFVAWVFGKGAWGRVELNGMSLQSFITPAGASFSNALAQGRKIGNKIMWKSFIIDNAFFARIEAASAFTAGLPA